MKRFLILLAFCTTLHAQSPRIIGGKPAHPAQYLYAASIYRTTPGGRYFCSGTLLSNQWVLTTATCVQSATSLTINLGSTEREGKGQSGLQLSTDTYIVHPDFDGNSLAANIALIQFRAPITFSDYIKPVDYLPEIRLANGVPVFTYGWGQQSDSSEMSDELMWTNLVTLSDDECRLTYGSNLQEDMVCAEGNFNQGTCNGDIGSPLIQYIGRGYASIVGVASFVSGNGCESTDPSGFTRIFDYTAWIRDVTEISS